MISFETDNSIIYSFLESTDNLFADFENDHVGAFDLGDDHYLFIYQAHNRDFILWKAAGAKQSHSVLLMLGEAVQLQEGLSVSVTEMAIALIEDKIISGTRTRFFDAH
ncbi:MAG TPA: hypothetical protein VF868_05515 [Bacteroidia bacterium]|jgi:hypothetical protein